VDVFEFVRVGAGEGQQPADDLRDAPALVDDAVDHLLLKLRARRLLVLEQLREVDDAVQWVVDLVRHAGREFADGGQLR
jgi:hypothetical protein